MIPAQQLARVLARVERGDLAAGEVRALEASVRDELRARCAADGWFFTKFVTTRDEADAEQSEKPWPRQEAYLRALWADLDAAQVAVIAKSRQMLVSWALCVYAVHWARSRAHQAVYWQTQNWPDAVTMVAQPDGPVQGRMQFIEAHLPEWLRQPAKYTEGRIQYPNGSVIQALAGGANQIRSKVFSLYIGDEFAHLEEQHRIWTSVAPLVQKGARAILCSTPNGADNEFATLWHGYKLEDGRGALGGGAA